MGNQLRYAQGYSDFENELAEGIEHRHDEGKLMLLKKAQNEVRLKNAGNSSSVKKASWHRAKAFHLLRWLDVPVFDLSLVVNTLLQIGMRMQMAGALEEEKCMRMADEQVRNA